MDQLEKRVLGQTGLTVSCLGLGTVKIGRNQGVKYPRDFVLPDDRQVQSLLDVARSLGINLLDTAPAYGESEQRLGELLSNRGDWIICSKVGEEFNQGLSSFDFSEKHVKYSIERSLKRLKTDYLDIVLIHSDGNDRHIIENTDCLATLADLKGRGLIKSYGMSTKTVAGGLLAAQHSDVVMVTYNPDERDDDLVIDQAARLNKGVLIKKGLSSGHLQSVSGSQNDAVYDAMNFIFRKPGVSSIIIGTISTDHLRENTETAIRVLSNS